MMDVPMYSGFVERTVILLVIITICMFYTLHYARKISKDPTKSAMGNTDWMETYHAETGDGMEVVAFNPRAALVTVLFFAQYFVIVYMMTMLGMENTITPAVQIPVAIHCGLIYGQNLDKIGAAFAKGTSGMAFVAAVIGLAGTMSLVMENGNILHTIVYYACLPPRELSLGLASVGMSAIVAFLNLFVPSASSKNPNPYHQADGRKPGHVRQPGCFRIPVRRRLHQPGNPRPGRSCQFAGNRRCPAEQMAEMGPSHHPAHAGYFLDYSVLPGKRRLDRRLTPPLSR